MIVSYIFGIETVKGPVIYRNIHIITFILKVFLNVYYCIISDDCKIVIQEDKKLLL